MSRVKKIVTSEVEGRNLSDFYGDNSYSFDATGQINYYGENKMGPVIEPGIVYGSNADSGDGYGYNTIKLIPHAPDGSINDDRYLVIDPTAPNHIHIRAGGIQDASNAELILGAEQANVKVTDWNHQVQINSYDVANDFNRNWSFENNGSLYGPGSGGNLKVVGIENGDGVSNLNVTSSGAMTISATGGDMNFYMDGGMYIGPSDSGNQIIKRSDLNSLPNEYFQSVRWTPDFTATGLTFTGTDTTHPAYQSYYVKQGQLVSFWIAVDCATVTNFGTGQLKLSLPFPPLPGTMNHFSGWVNVDATQNPDLAGHIIVNADHLQNTSVLDLHYIKQSGGANSPVMEAMLMQNIPVVLTTNTKIYVNGTYICE